MTLKLVTRWTFVPMVMGMLIGILFSFASYAEEGSDFFEKKIRPVLVEQCYSCHSSEAPKLKGGLRLDDKAALLKGGESGPAIVPGDPEKSLLYQALRYEGEGIRMPPKGKLSEEIIGDFAEWIRMGAPDPREEANAKPAASETPGAPKREINLEEARKHWAFQPLKKSSAQNVDDYLLAPLREAGLSPAPLADKRTLIRRATFDLTGLPPTVEETRAFLSDESPDAFSKVVERLLASPRYGERWGRHWLDVARYTDFFDSRSGEAAESDCTEAWRYRDWVVKSFNDDMPYDRFLQMQIAGDLLPSPDGQFHRDGVIATGLLAIGNWPGGDADKEKMVSDIVDDQIDVVTRGMMGVTVACARCHDHKFDPFTTEDYYALAGIFYSSHIIPGPGNKTEGSPMLHIPLIDPAEMTARREREKRMGELRAELQNLANTESLEAAKRLIPDTGKYMMAARAIHMVRKLEHQGEPGTDIDDFAGHFRIEPEFVRRWVDYLGFDEGTRLPKYFNKNLHGMEGLHALNGENGMPSLTANTNPTEAVYVTIRQPARSIVIHPSVEKPVALGWKSPITGAVAIKGYVLDADANCGGGIRWSLEVRRTGETAHLLVADLGNGGSREFADEAKAQGIPDSLSRIEIKAGEMIQVVIAPNGDYSCDTTTVQIEIAELEGEKRNWNLAEEMLAGFKSDVLVNPRPDKFGNADVWHFMDLINRDAKGNARKNPLMAQWETEVGNVVLDRWTPTDVAAAEGAERVSKRLNEVLNTPVPDKNDPYMKLYDELLSPTSPFRMEIPLEKWNAERRASREKLQTELTSLEAIPAPPIDLAVGIQEGGVPNTAYTGIRDVKVHIRGHYGRLGEIVPRRFPRVLSDDPATTLSKMSGRLELARWVASEKNPLTARVMVNRIWQRHFGEGLARTPGNFGKLGEPPSHPELLDFLARKFIESGWSLKAMHRLMMLSDAYQRASASGDPEFVKLVKHDPENRLFGRMARRRLEAEALRDALLATSGRLDSTLGGPSIRDLGSPRRTLYLRTIRSDRSNFGALFDAADAAAIVDKRTEATVAPQALFLMNSPFVLEQARALAEWVASPPAGEGTPNVPLVEKIGRLYERLYARPATLGELNIGLKTLKDSLGENDHPNAPSVSAWEPYCQVLLCANEFMYVD